MNEYKELDVNEVIKIRKDIDRDIYRNQLLIGSCEAKLNRVDPLSDEYNKTIDLIDKTYKEILELQMLRTKTVTVESELEGRSKRR